MSKGKASQGSLKALAYPIQQFLAGWSTRHRPKPYGTGEIPAPYELAAIKGEAILRQRFFGEFMQKIPIQFTAAQQIELWRRLVEQGGQITAWVQRLGVAQALRREIALPEPATHESRMLYTLLLQALAEEAPELLPWAVDGFFYHVWKQQFSHQPEGVDKKTTQAQIRRDQLTRTLRKHHGQAVTVKESYKETSENVQFTLLYKTKAENQWRTLVNVERPRLKTARNAAYDEALKSARSELVIE